MSRRSSIPRKGVRGGFHIRYESGVLIGVGIVLLYTVTRGFRAVAWPGLGAAFGPPLILGLLWKKTTATGTIAGSIVGFATILVWKNVPALSSKIYELVPGFSLGFFTVWVVSLIEHRRNKMRHV